MSKYSVKNKSDEVVFETTSGLKAEFVAISLALVSLYGEPEIYSVYQDKKCINAFDTGNAFAAMQSKMRNLVYNRKVSRQMPLIVNTAEDYAQAKYLSGKKNGMDSQYAMIHAMGKLYDFIHDEEGFTQVRELGDKDYGNNTN